MSIDRRQFKRFETLLIVEIGPHKEGTSYFFGITKNVSLEGFIFESQNYDLRQGDIFEFRLKHPKSTLSVPVVGEIMWNRHAKFECHSGVKFHRFNDETKSRMFELISADTGEHASHGMRGEEVRRTAEQNGGMGQDSREKGQTLSESIGEAVRRASHDQTRQDDKTGREPLPLNQTKQEEKQSNEPLTADRQLDAVDEQYAGDEEHADKENVLQEDSTAKPSRETVARQRGRKRGRPFTLVFGVFFALAVITTFLMFLSDGLREKMNLLFGETGIENAEHDESVVSIPEQDEPYSAESAPPATGHSDSLPEDTKQNTGEYALSEDRGRLGPDPDEESAGYEEAVSDVRPAGLPEADQSAPVHQGNDLLSEDSTAETQAAVPVKSQPAKDEVKSVAEQVTEKKTESRNIQKAGIPVLEKKRETVKTDSAPGKQEPQSDSPSLNAVKTEKADLPGDTKPLKQPDAQKKIKDAEKNERDSSPLPSGPERKEVVSREPSGLQKTAAVTENNVFSSKRAFPVQVLGEDPEVTKKLPLSEERDSIGTIQTVQDPIPGSENNEQAAKKKATPPQRTSPEPQPDKKDVSPGDSAGTVVSSRKPEQNPVPNKPEVEKAGEEMAAVKGSSTKTQDRDGPPKVALVLESASLKDSDVQKKPEINDTYLEKYFTAYMDSFNDNSNSWDLFDIGAASARIEGGSYHIENRKRGGALIVLHFQRFPHENDFVVEVSMRLISGVEKNSYGFIFGAKDARDNYSFQISENKYYAVKNYHNGISAQLTAGEMKDSFIQKDAPVVLKVVKHENDIRFSINSVHVAEVSNLEFYGSQIGFIVEGEAHIAVDYTRSYIRSAE